MLKHLLHTETENMLEMVREWLRGEASRPVRLLSAAKVPTLHTNPTPAGGGADDVEYEGTDFSIANNTTVKKVFATLADWFTHVDTYVGGPMLAKLDPVSGHTHTGVDGDGAKVSASHIIIDVTSGKSFEDHIAEASGSVGDAIPFAFFDDFTRTLSAWDKVGTVTLAPDVDGSGVALFTDGGALTLKRGAGTWTDGFVAEFALMWGETPGSLSVVIRAAETDRITVVIGENSITISETVSGNTSTLASEPAGVPPGAYYRVRIALYGSSVAVWANILEELPGSEFLVEPALPSLVHVSATATLTEGGGISLLAAGALNLRHFRVARTVRLDLGDLTDVTNLIGRPTGAAGHAATHAAGGTDAIDIGDLDNFTGALLTLAEKELLLPGGNMHTHDAKAVSSGGITAYAHVRDVLAHSRPAVASPTHTLAPLYSSIMGSAEDAARGDHTHVLPYILHDAYVSTTAPALNNTSGSSPTVHLCSADCFLPGAGSVPERYIPAPFMAFSRSLPPAGTGTYRHERYRFALWSPSTGAGQNILYIYFDITPPVAVVNETTETPAGAILLWRAGGGVRERVEEYGTSTRTVAASEPFTVNLAAGFNVIAIYASSGGYEERGDIRINRMAATRFLHFVPRPAGVAATGAFASLDTIYPGGY
jgi:hypothetical protein